MICANCGREMPETDKYCVICGTENPLFENADRPAWEHTPQTADQPVQEYTSSVQTADQPAREYTPYTQLNAEPTDEYRRYDHDMGTPAGNSKEKRTCSLSAVVFCGIVIFLLSVACGVLAGLYFNAKTAAVTAPYSIAMQASGERD